jgi:hypothetical protein
MISWCLREKDAINSCPLPNPSPSFGSSYCLMKPNHRLRHLVVVILLRQQGILLSVGYAHMIARPGLTSSQKPAGCKCSRRFRMSSTWPSSQ